MTVVALTIYHYSAQLLTCQQGYLISFLPILEYRDTSLFYFPRRANLVMQHFFLSSLSTKLCFYKPQRKTKLNSLLCSYVPLIMKREFSSAFQSHFKIQISKRSSSVLLIPVHKGVLGTEGQRFRFLQRRNHNLLQTYTLYIFSKIIKLYCLLNLSLIIIMIAKIQ